MRNKSAERIVGAAAPDRAELRLEAKALGDPTRYSLFRYIVDSHRQVDVSELTKFCGLNHNAVRQHLAVLEDAKLVSVRQEDRRRPGRPRLLYFLNPDAAGLWGTDSPYKGMAIHLANVIKSGRPSREVGREAGIKRMEGFRGNGSLIDVLNSDLTVAGFRPRQVVERDSCGFVLERCPFADVASVDPDTVCRLHLGMLEGVVDAFGGGGVEVSLFPRDPYQAGCLILLSGRSNFGGDVAGCST